MEETSTIGDLGEMDLVVIGAGIHGLITAKTHLQIHPHSHLLILDSSPSVGGVWSRSRLYPGLKTNNLLGSYEFSDYPMDPSRYGVRPGEHIPGEVVCEYLGDVLRVWGLERRVRFGWRVDVVEMVGMGKAGLDDGEGEGEGLDGKGGFGEEEMGWKVEVTILHGGDEGKKVTLHTKKLVVATGLTSEPYIPGFIGRDVFQRPLLHSKEMRERTDVVEGAKRVVVLGGNKSAWDVCYWTAMKGAHVDLVMRPGGGGPSWVWPVTFSPLRLSIQRLATTRFWTWFDPCIWDVPESGLGLGLGLGLGWYPWLKMLFHGIWIGRLIVALFWAALGRFVCRANRYDDGSHPDMVKLRPWTSTFWMGNSLSIHNYDTNWFDLIRQGRISVHIADVECLKEGEVCLKNGVSLMCDALVCCTGWKVVPPIKFLPEGIASDLGLPARRAKDDKMILQARAQILKDHPSLRAAPSRTLPSGTIDACDVPRIVEKEHGEAYQLYRFLVPSHERFLRHRNIAFIGSHLAIAAVMVAQVQALWITAYFDDRIDRLRLSNINFEAVRYETIKHTEYCKIRHPPQAGGCGHRCPDLVLDCLPYIDMLMGDLGLRVFRKPSRWKEMFERYTPADFKGVVDEWKAMNIEKIVT